MTFHTKLKTGLHLTSHLMRREVSNQTKEELTSQTQGVENKLRAVEDCKAGVLLVFISAVLKALKVFGAPSWANLSNLRDVH